MNGLRVNILNRIDVRIPRRDAGGACGRARMPRDMRRVMACRADRRGRGASFACAVKLPALRLCVHASGSVRIEAPSVKTNI